MAVTAVDIVNAALTDLGQPRLISLTQDTEAARTMQSAYPVCRDELLSSHAWKFALGRETLALQSAQPLFGFARQHRLPADFLNLRDVYPADLHYRMNGNLLLCDRDVVQVEYTRHVSDPNEMTPMFRSVLSSLLALRTCKKICGGSLASTERVALQEEYRIRLAVAKSADAQSGGPDTLPRPRHLMNSRYGNVSPFGSAGEDWWHGA